jgi:hypothetical protein
MQHTSQLLMIKPVHFDFNAETAVNNSFQSRSADTQVQEKALQEFENFIAVLRNHGIDVTVIEDTPEPHTPDSVFPNNWISFHDGGIICLYPMFAVNRRLERKEHVLETIRQKFNITTTIDLTAHESDHVFLEGTGSMVLDRDNRIAYACLSPRTDKNLLQEFCNELDYRPVAFTAVDVNGLPIYHTNVMMCVADSYTIICLDSIRGSAEKETVVKTISQTGKQLIAINFDQMNHFAGNMLQVHNKDGEKFLVMSSQAYKSLLPQQIEEIEKFNPIIHADISTIETNGGGSARCMIAEVFLPPLPFGHLPLVGGEHSS